MANEDTNPLDVTDDEDNNNNPSGAANVGSYLASLLGGQLMGPALTNPNYSSAVGTLQNAQNTIQGSPVPATSSLQYNITPETQTGTINPAAEQSVSTGPNAYNNISVNPMYLQAANNALGGLQNVANNGGLTALDQAQLSAIQQQNATAARGAQEAIANNAQARGMAGGGQQILQSMINQQQAATNNSQQGLGVAAQAQARALQALQSSGQLGAGLQSQLYGQGAQAANAQNAINQYNATNQQGVNAANTQALNQAQAYNVGTGQQVANTNAQAQTQANQYNAAQNQTQFQDILGKNVAAGNVANNVANAQQKLGQTQTQQTSNSTSSLGNLLNAGGSNSLANQAINGIGSLFNSF